MADHVGIYEILGKMMPSPTCKVDVSRQITEKNVDIPNFQFVLSENRSVHHEVVVKNALFSGTETIEASANSATRNLYYTKSPRFLVYGQVNQLSYLSSVSPNTEGRTTGITTSSAGDSYAVFIDFSNRLDGAASISGGLVFIPAIEPDPTAPSGSDSEDAARVYNKTIGIQTTVAQANDANAFLSRQDYTRTTEERWSDANQESVETLSTAAVAASTGGSDSSSRVQVDPSLDPITVMVARSNRQGGSIYNGTTTPMYASLGGVASTTSFSAKLYPDDLFELPSGWVGSVSVVWASIGTGQAQVIEYF